MPHAPSSAPLPDPADLPDPASVERAWLDSYPPGVPPTWSLPAVPVTRFVDDAARDFADGAAIWFDGHTLTWAEVADLVDRVATVLQRLGVGVGHRVAVAEPGLPSGVVAVFAALRVGAAVAIVDPAGGMDRAVDAVATTGAMVAVGGEALTTEIEQRRDALPLLQHVVVVDRRCALPRSRWRLPLPGRRRLEHADDGIHHFDDLLADAAPTVEQAAVDLDAVAVIAHGSAAPAALSNRHLVAAAFQARLWVPDARAGRERVLSMLAADTSTSVAVGVMATALSAGCMVLPSSRDAHATVAAIDDAQPTVLLATPATYRAIVEHPRLRRHDLTSVRVAVSGGGPLPAGVAAEFERIAGGAHLREGHGVAAAPVTHATPIYGRAMAGTIGLPLTDTVACVVDDDGRVCPPGHPGHLLVHGPQVAADWVQGAAGGTARSGSGWLRTGDVAEQSADGLFRLVGRVADDRAASPVSTAEEAD